MTRIPDLPVGTRRSAHAVLVDLERQPVPLDLAALFGNGNEVELEVGVGKGRFILLAATARPAANFLGVEVARRYLQQAVDRVAKRDLEIIESTKTDKRFSSDDWEAQRNILDAEFKSVWKAIEECRRR